MHADPVGVLFLFYPKGSVSFDPVFCCKVPMIGLAGVYNDAVDKNKTQEENSMEYGNIIAEKIQDLLAILDASDAPAVYGYLGKCICGEEDALHFAPMSIVNTLQKMQPLLFL